LRPPRPLVERARELRDELNLITGIADSAAERIVNAVSMANAQRGTADGEAADTAEAEAIAEAVAAMAEAA
jgi:hypothetical protein